MFVKKDVRTHLLYWQKPKSGREIVDFRRPNAEDKFLELAKHDEKRQVWIRDIRGEESRYTLERNGFQYMCHDIPETHGWSNDARTMKVIISKTEELVRKVTGARKTIAYAHRIRCFASGERAPVHIVHSDFTVLGAMQNLRKVINDPVELEQLSQGRIVALNVWRPLRTIQKDPLAICDWTSMNPGTDFIPNRFVFPDGLVEMAKVQYSEQHRWYYLGDQTPKEPVIFKQFDSREIEQGGCTLAHTAFVDPDHEDRGPRESLEIGIYAFFPG